MKSIILFIALSFSINGLAQLICTNASGASETQYTNGAIDDTVYFFCDSTVLANLEVTPESGVPGWDFQWYEFNVGTNSWTPLTLDSNVPTSSLNGVPEGGYKVTVTDGVGDIVGCYRAWIVKVLQNGSLDVTATPITCGVNLFADLQPGLSTPYYNPPPDPIVVDSSSEINVSFSAQHTYVSDLGYYLIGPASCGSPVVALSPVNYQIGLPINCNPGNNVDSLTFSTLSTNVFNVCTMPTPLTGTFGIMGNNVPIDWSPVYGCDATEPGWKVQIFDCVGLDIGFLTEADISITGLTVCGDTATQNFASGPIMAPINDNACNNFVAATYEVPVAPADAVLCDFEYEWNADPWFFIPDSTTSLNINLVPGPSVYTVFTLDIIKSCDGAGCCGGNYDNSDDYYPPAPPVVNVTGPPQLCEGDAPTNFIADLPGGTWSGPGITNSATGEFDPALAGPGIHQINYNGAPWTCGVTGSSTTIEVVSQNIPNITGPSSVCENDVPFNLTSDIPGGVWSGTGITDVNLGTFDPTAAGPGFHVIVCFPAGGCAGPGQITIEVLPVVTPTINVPQTLCFDAGLQDFTPSIPGGDWIGNGFTGGMFDPSLAGIGIHQVGYFVAGGCSDTAWASVEVTDAIPADVSGFASVCLNGDSLALPDPLGGTWSGPGIVSGTNIFVAANAGVGIHDLEYAVNAPCTSPGNYQVEVLPLPPSDFTADITESCAPAVFILSPANQNLQWNYEWNVDGNNSTAMTDTLYTNTSGTYTASLTVTDGNGCSSTTEKIDYLIVHPSPTAAFSTNGGTFYNTTVQFNNQSTNATAYTWTFDNLGMSHDEHPSFTFPAWTVGNYNVCLVALNDFGCSDTTCQDVIIDRDGGCYAPNSFSPNGDSKNETFLPIVSGYVEESYILTIFNRWGEQIFQTNNADQGWDGTEEGSLVQDGVYIWTINIVDENTDLPVEYQGHVTLLK